MAGLRRLLMAPEAGSSCSATVGLGAMFPRHVRRLRSPALPTAIENRRPASGRNVFGEEGQFAGREPLRRNGLASRVGYDVAHGALLLRQDNQIGSRPARSIENIDGRRGRFFVIASRRRGREQFPRLGVGVECKRLLDLPLVLDERHVRLVDAVVRAPGVLVVEDHVAPRGGELLGGIAAGSSIAQSVSACTSRSAAVRLMAVSRADEAAPSSQ